MQQPDEWVCDVPSTAVGEEPQPRPEALCKPQCAAQFTSFVVHILTGELVCLCVFVAFLGDFCSLIRLLLETLHIY